MLSTTKRGRHERVLVRSPVFAQWLKRWLKLFAPTSGGPLAACSYARVRAWLPKLARVLGLGHVPWRSHSFRRGSATHCWLNLQWALSDVALYGRWASESSCRLYIRSAERALADVDAGVSPDFLSRRARLASLGATVFDVDVSLEACQKRLREYPCSGSSSVRR